MPPMARIFIAFGAISAAAAIILGAAAAHLPGAAQAAGNSSFQTALQLHQFHALGLLAIGLIAAQFSASRWIAASGSLLIVGTLLFSGNIYLRQLAGIDHFRMAVPWGGGAWMLGWLSLAIGILRARPAERRPASADF